MPTYHIYPYINAQEDVAPIATVEVSDDEAKIVSIEGPDSDTRANAERTLRDYVDSGFTPVEAIEWYAGPYGEVAEINTNNQVIE